MKMNNSNNFHFDLITWKKDRQSLTLRKCLIHQRSSFQWLSLLMVSAIEFILFAFGRQPSLLASLDIFFVVYFICSLRVLLKPQQRQSERVSLRELPLLRPATMCSTSFLFGLWRKNCSKEQQQKSITDYTWHQWEKDLRRVFMVLYDTDICQSVVPCTTD